MFWFSVGTAGELIKIYPLLRLATERGLPWYALATGQSPVNFRKQWENFNLPADRLGFLLETDRDLHTSRDAFKWFARAQLRSAGKLRDEIERLAGVAPNPARDYWLVHGDTLSTWVGAGYARRLGLRLVHVEAGLRSDRLFHPFPEEITRRFVSRLARLHFAQDARAVANLHASGVKGEVINTGGNTLLDAIRYVLRDFPVPTLPPTPFVVANVHRFENLNSAHRWSVIVDVLIRAALRQPVYLVQHPPTQAKLDRDPALKARLEAAGVRLLPRQPFTQFIHFINGAEYVISDGGSNQEECFYLGKPCLLLRESTERVEGLEGACLLTKFEAAQIDRFLEDPASFRAAAVGFETQPCATILETLV